MRIKVKKTWKDLIDKKPHPTLSRRDFLSRGFATSVATVALPHALSMAMAKNAFGATSCPPQARTPGALAQIYRDGGPTVGAMFINQQQATMMNATIAANYGIVQTDVTQVGANYYLSKSSPFGMAIMTPPPGFSQATWNAVLAKTSLGGHYGAFNQDDGAGENSGLLGGSASFKPSVLGKDLRINNQAALANWARGIPSTGVSGGTTGLTSANVAKNFGIAPAAGISSQLVTNAAVAADSLSSLFMGLFGAQRTQAQAAVQSAVCGFYGDSPLASSTYGNSLFNPTAVSALSSAITLASLSAEEQALLAAYYQSATGSVGGVFVQQNGCDYHGQSVATTINPSDYEAGRMVAMFIAACQVANTKGAMIILHNGQAIANGTQSAAFTFGSNKEALTATGPVAQGDAGGAYNAGFILAYDPSSAPALQTTGTFDSASGNVTAAAAVAASSDAVAGLYLTALAHLGMNVSAASSKMASSGVSSAGTPSNIMLIS
jgi:hypothetical protein